MAHAENHRRRPARGGGDEKRVLAARSIVIRAVETAMLRNRYYARLIAYGGGLVGLYRPCRASCV